MDWRRRLLLAATGLAWSCQASESLVDAPVLSQVRQVVLQDSLAGLAWPTALATDPDGGFYVLEIRFGMVHRFHSDGGFLRHYGVPGDGPGELRLPVAAGTVADTILAVADLAHQGVELFDRRTGGSLGRLPVPERPSSIAAAGGDLWVGAIAEAKGTALFRGTAPSGPLTAVGRLPVEYQAGGVVAGNYSRVIAVPGTDGTVLVGFEASDSLDLMDAAGRWTRLHLPRRTRRGLLAEANTVLRTKRFDEIMVAQSSLTALARMSDGSIAAKPLGQTGVALARDQGEDLAHRADAVHRAPAVLIGRKRLGEADELLFHLGVVGKVGGLESRKLVPAGGLGVATPGDHEGERHDRGGQWNGAKGKDRHGETSFRG